jgi:CBS-domain-containing membrane protein
MPLACFLTAGGGLLCWKLGGHHPLAAAASMAWGFLVLYVLKLHIPPAMAVGLIPLIMTRPTVAFPVAVGLGTLLLTICYLGYRRLLKIQPYWPLGRG